MIYPVLSSIKSVRKYKLGGLLVEGTINIGVESKTLSIVIKELGDRMAHLAMGVGIHVEKESEWSKLIEEGRHITVPHVTPSVNHLFSKSELLHWGDLEVNIDHLGLNKAIFIDDSLYYQVDFDFNKILRGDFYLNDKDSLKGVIKRNLSCWHDVDHPKCRVSFKDNRVLIPVEEKEIIVRGVSKKLFPDSPTKSFVFIQKNKLRATNHGIMDELLNINGEREKILKIYLTKQFNFAEVMVYEGELIFTRFIFERTFSGGSIWGAIKVDNLKFAKVVKGGI